MTIETLGLNENSDDPREILQVLLANHRQTEEQSVETVEFARVISDGLAALVEALEAGEEIPAEDLAAARDLVTLAREKMDSLDARHQTLLQQWTALERCGIRNG